MPRYDDNSFRRGLRARIALFILGSGSSSTGIIVNDVDKEHRNLYKFFKRRNENISISKDRDNSKLILRRK